MSRARRAALYLRVSTADKQTPENQERPLRDYCAAQGLTVVSVYLDRDSGAKANRVEFARMFQDAARGRFDVLLFWSLDRFGRLGAARTLQALEQLKNGYRVDWLSYTQPELNTAGPFGEMLIAFFAAFASLERSQIQARVKAGLDRARAQGKTLGRPRRAPLTTEQQTQIQTLKAAGQSIRQIAAALSIQKTQVHEHLKDSLCNSN